MNWLGVRSNRLRSAIRMRRVHPLPAHRHQFFNHRQIHIGQLLEVEAALAGGVLAQLAEQRGNRGAFGQAAQHIKRASAFARENAARHIVPSRPLSYL